MVARVALSGAVYSIDKLYDYLVPDRLEKEASVGKRVSVPFARGNRRQECTHAEDYDYIIINDELDIAAAEAAAVMTAEKCRTAERLHILKEDKTL